MVKTGSALGRQNAANIDMDPMMKPDCIVWDVDPVAVWIGSFPLTWYGIFVGIVFLCSLYSVDWQFKRAGFPTEGIFWLCCGGFFGAIFGGIIAHRVFYEWELMLNDPWSLFDFRRGITGMASHGSFLGVFAVTWWWAKRNKIRYLDFLDRIAIAGATSAIFVRLGNLMNSEVLGRPTEVPWAFCFLRVDPMILVPRHPTQIYEAINGAISLGLLLLLDWKKGGEQRPLGMMCGVFIAVYFFNRFFIEFFKAHQALSQDSVLTMGQFLGIPGFLLGVGILVWSFKNKIPVSQR